MSTDGPAPKGANKISRRSVLGLIAATAAVNVGQAAQAAEKSYLSELSVPADLQSYASKVKSFRLDNGAKFIVLERGVSATVSFVTYVDVGGADEEDGKTGIAHFLEHLAFKGTESIGTRDYNAEREVLDKLDDLAERRTELMKSKGNRKAVADIQNEVRDVEAQAEKFVIANDFAKIVQKEGGVGLNAATSIDSTQYYYNFPSNKLELWFALESERFAQPVFRQFEKERSVVLEERKLRVDNDSVGKFLEDLLLKAFEKHPYRRPVIGFEQDVAGLTRRDVKAFFEKYYRPQNITFAIVGDVEYGKVRQLAQKYFGKLRNAPDSDRTTIVEPAQTGERQLTMKLNAEPYYVEAYHVPGLESPMTPAIRLLEGVLSGGRTSRLFRSLIVQQQVALQASFSTGFPGDKYPNLGLLFALPAPGTPIDKLAGALRREVERVKVDGTISEAELDRVKRAIKVAYLGSFQSNEVMASYLCEYAAKTGDAKNALRALTALDSVRPDDVSRVARLIFTEENRTVGRLI